MANEEIGLIQGKEPDSINEWYVHLALLKYDIRYKFQIELFGGQRLAGGQVLDFLILEPFPQPVQVMDRYWHKGQLDNRENYNLSVMEQHYGREVIILWGHETKSLELADQTVLKKIVNG